MRRSMWRKAAAATGALALGAALAACGSSSDNAGDRTDKASGPVTINFLKYSDWVGKTETAAFETAKPGIKIKQLAMADGGSSALAAQLAKGKGNYDLVAIGNYTGARLEAGKLLEKFDPASVPNLAAVPKNYRDQFPWGIPTDLGKVGIIYNKDKVANPPTSWKQLFEDADQYKGKIILPDYDLDVEAIALLALGYDVNTTDSDQLKKAAALVQKIKPDVLAFKSDGQAKDLVSGAADIAVGYDYTFAGAKNDKLGWVSPSEGTPGYLEGIAIPAGAKNVDAALKFLNYRLEPENYGSFINNTGASYILPAAEKYLSAEIKNSPALKINSSVPFFTEEFKGADAEAVRSQLWTQIQAAS